MSIKAFDKPGYFPKHKPFAIITVRTYFQPKFKNARKPQNSWIEEVD